MQIRKQIHLHPIYYDTLVSTQCCQTGRAKPVDTKHGKFATTQARHNPFNFVSSRYSLMLCAVLEPRV